MSQTADGTITLNSYAKLAIAARDFVWEPENWEHFQEMKGSNSMALPVEFMELAHAVEDMFGKPNWDV